MNKNRKEKLFDILRPVYRKDILLLISCQFVIMTTNQHQNNFYVYWSKSITKIINNRLPNQNSNRINGCRRPETNIQKIN